MGKKARERRKREKTLFGKLVRLQHFRETEFGELKRRMTKAEARRRLIAMAEAFARVEREIVERALMVAWEEVCAEEDARFFSSIEGATAQL